jgi:hypothetical protein
MIPLRFQLQILRSVIGTRDSAVSIAIGHRLDSRGVGVRVRLGQDSSPLHVSETSSGAGSGLFPGDKAAGT